LIVMYETIREFGAYAWNVKTWNVKTWNVKR